MKSAELTVKRVCLHNGVDVGTNQLQRMMHRITLYTTWQTLFNSFGSGYRAEDLFFSSNNLDMNNVIRIYPPPFNSSDQWAPDLDTIDPFTGKCKCALKIP